MTVKILGCRSFSELNRPHLVHIKISQLLENFSQFFLSTFFYLTLLQHYKFIQLILRKLLFQQHFCKRGIKVLTVIFLNERGKQN